MIVAGSAKDLVAAVHLAADLSQVASGTIYAAIRLESDDSDDGKFWDADDDSWQASPVAWPEADHLASGLWGFALPAAATTGKAGAKVRFIFTDDLDETLATTMCLGGEHGVYSGIPTTSPRVLTGAAKDVGATVHLAADRSQVSTGTVYAVIRLESDDADDGKFWDADDDSWQASPVAWPEATHVQGGLWLYELPLAAIAGKSGDSLHVTLTDDVDPSLATTVCLGAEHYVAEVSASLCTIYGTILDAAGDPVVGAEVDAYATTPQAAGGSQMGSHLVHVATDAAGYFEFSLQRGAEVRFTIEDAGYDATMTVPDAESQDITTWV